MAKTYIPGAVNVATSAHKYLTRYQATLTGSATAGQIAALTELVSCLATFLANWHKPPPAP